MDEDDQVENAAIIMCCDIVLSIALYIHTSTHIQCVYDADGFLWSACQEEERLACVGATRCLWWRDQEERWWCAFTAQWGYLATGKEGQHQWKMEARQIRC